MATLELFGQGETQGTRILGPRVLTWCEPPCTQVARIHAPVLGALLASVRRERDYGKAQDLRSMGRVLALRLPSRLAGADVMKILQQHDPDGWWLHPVLERGPIVPRCHNLRGCYW